MRDMEQFVAWNSYADVPDDARQALTQKHSVTWNEPSVRVKCK